MSTSTEPFRISELCQALKVANNDTTHRAIRRARELAEADGLHFPVACPANDFSYTVTDDPAAAFDPVLHLARIAQGVEATKQVGVEFMEGHVKRLEPLAAAYLALEQEMARVADAQRVAMERMTKTFIDIRRTGRVETEQSA